MKIFRLKFLLLFFALALALPPAQADEVTVCDGTSGTTYLPVYGYNFDYSQHNQMIYPLSELSGLPTGCFITSITFYPTSAIEFKGADVTFSMANLEGAAPFEVDGYGYSSPLDVAVTTVGTMTPAGQTILTIELAEPFQYDGGDLLIDVTTPGKTYGDNTFYSKQLGDYYGFYSYGSTEKATNYLPKLTIAYTAESKPYAASVNPKSIDFGKVAPNTSHTQNVTIKNIGENAITPTVSGLDAPFSATNIPASIAAGETATITIEFNPTTADSFNSTLHIGAQESEDIDLNVTLAGQAAYEMTVCDGTTTNAYLPVYGLYVDEYAQNTQMIYPAEMLQSINGKAITSLTFYLNSGLNFGTTVTFSLKNLDANTPEYASTPVPIEGYTAVKTETVVKNSSLSEWTVTFDQPFVYSGGDLLLNVETIVGSYGSTYFLGANQTTNQSYYTSGKTTKTRSKFLPKVTIGFEDTDEPPIVNVDAPVFNPEDGTTFEENLTVTLTCATAGATIQYSNNGEYFTNYTAPIVIDETTTLYAKAVLGDAESQVVSATYTKEAAPQPFEPMTFVKVNAADQLVAGKKYIIVCGNKALGVAPTGNFLTAIDVTAGDEVTISDNTVAIMTLGGTLNHYTLALGDNYLHAVNTTSLDYGSSTEWAISDYNGTLAGYRVKHADANRAVRYQSSNNRFGNYSTTDQNSEYGWIYVEKEEVTPQPEQVATPTFDPEEGTYTAAQNVTITCETEGATIHYTTDGTEPTAESPVYSEAIAVGETMTIKVIAMKEDMTNSAIASATYTINIPQVATPTFDPAQGEYTEAQNVTITCETEGAAIYYTTDGTEPTAESPVYSEAIAVGETMTIKAIAMKEGMANSAIASATYTINIPVPVEGTTFVKVNAADQLVAGKKYIIVSGNKALGVAPTGNFLTAIDVTAGDEVTISDDGVAIMTLGGTLGHYTLALGNTYLHAVNSTSLDYGSSTEWAISDYNGTLAGYRVKHADYNRAVRYQSSNNRFGNYSTTDQNSEYGWIYVEKEEVTPQPEQVATPTFDPEEGEYTVVLNVAINCETEDATIHYTTDGTEPTAESPVYGAPIEVAETMTIKAIAMKADMTDSEVASATYTINLPAPEPVATPTFSLVSGSYTGVQTLNLNCETEGATISYSTDGGESWTAGSTVTVDQDMTIIIKAEKNGVTSETATAYFIIDIPAELPTITPLDGYYSIKNLGNNQYANIAGRKTLNFTNDIDTKAGTVIRVKTNENGKVEVLRSQAADLQGYANRAMKYVPEIVQLIADKLNAEGDGALLGDEGLDELMEKFNESFDYHLYVEEAEGGYRLYGKTPSMQPVVDFYREHTHQVETKLPMLEGFINDAIQKLLEKTGGSGESILQPFSLHETWSRMGGTLTEPVDDASTMAFYREVLNNKNYVWSFAYETAMTYWERVKAHDKYEELKEELGEFAEYIEKIEYVRPETKYYVVQKDGKPDYISEDNKDIINNNGRTIWTVEPREKFVVNFPEENLVSGKYATTLYTDFAYDLPEGVTAYKVTRLTNLGDAQLTALSGTVPAQTPVILKAEVAGNQELTLNTNDGTAPTDNLLVGADYFIKEYGINTPQVEKLFGFAKYIFGENFYNNNVAKYEHLMLKTAGTVNNKYMWGMSAGDLDSCTYDLDGTQDCVVRTLSTGEKGLGFYSIWSAPANQAFLASEEFNPIRLGLRGDVNRDGFVKIDDASAIIDILLDGPESMSFDPQYDYDAADFDEDGRIFVKDVSALIDYLLQNNLRKK